MQITVTVSDEMMRAAQERGLSVQEFVESLIDKGFSAAQQTPNLNSAIERIRALRFGGNGR